MEVMPSRLPYCGKGWVEVQQCNCNHTKGDVYFQMYWYRQLPGQTLELIVFISIAKNVNDHDYGNLSTEKFSASKSVPESGTFTVTWSQKTEACISVL